MINILICDDNSRLLSIMKNSIRSTISAGKFSDLEYELYGFTDSRSALLFCLENGCEISFLDIDMPGLNGFDVARAIHEKNEDAIIIFVTSHENYVFSSLRYRPFRFIRKARLGDELGEALDSALSELINKNKFLEFGGRNGNKKILIRNIVYLESKRNYAEVVCTDGERYMCRSTMNDLDNELTPAGFLRIHAGFLVNMAHIDRLSKGSVVLCNGEELSISRRYYSQAHRTFAEFLRT